MRHIRLNPDLLSGLFFIAVGGLAVGVASGYRLGTPENMGPGFFPIMLGIALLLIGIAVAAMNIRQDEGPPSLKLRPIIVVLGGVAAFGLLVGQVGLVITIGIIVALCSMAGWRTNLREQFILFVCLATIVSGIFVVALGLPIPLWPQW